MPRIPTYIVDKLKELSCLDVAVKLGLQVNRYKCLCFDHKESKPSLNFRRNGKYWKCFSCGIGGGPISLVMHHRHFDFKEACKWLCATYGIMYEEGGSAPYRRPLPNLTDYTEIGTNTDKKTFDSEIAEWVLANTSLGEIAFDFLVNQRKIKEEVLEQLNIRSIQSSNTLLEHLIVTFERNRLAESGWITEQNGKTFLRIYTPCLLIPYYDVDSKLVGLQTRFLGDKKDAPRFQFVSGSKPSIFNIGVIKGLYEGDNLFLTEGITDCLAMLSEDKPCVAIPSATSIPSSEIGYLLPFKLSMSVDRDEAGERAYRSLLYLINKMGGNLQKLQYPKEYKDYGDYHSNNVSLELPKGTTEVQELKIENLYEQILDELNNPRNEIPADRWYIQKRQLANFLFGTLAVRHGSKYDLPTTSNSIFEDDWLLSFTYLLGITREFNFNWSYLLKYREVLTSRIDGFLKSIPEIVDDVNSIFTEIEPIKGLQISVYDVLAFELTEDNQIYTHLNMMNFNHLFVLASEKTNYKIMKHGSTLGTIIRERKDSEDDLDELKKLIDSISSLLNFYDIKPNE